MARSALAWAVACAYAQLLVHLAAAQGEPQSLHSKITHCYLPTTLNRHSPLLTHAYCRQQYRPRCTAAHASAKALPTTGGRLGTQGRRAAMVRCTHLAKRP